MNTRMWLHGWLRERTRERARSLGEIPTEVGRLGLATFQGHAVARLVQILGRYHGALLADAVGLGKTRVALATTAKWLERPDALPGPVWIVAPARLQEAWRVAARAAGFADENLVFLTHMSLSLQEPPQGPAALVLVDEAHRFRNGATRRSQALAALAMRSPVLLITATPVVNGLEDLEALLRLFLSEEDLRGAVGLDLTQAFARAERGELELATAVLEHVMVRRERVEGESGFGRRPRVALEVLEYEAPAAEAQVWATLEGWARRIRRAAWGGRWPQALFVEHVLRRWESGPEALEQTLQGWLRFHERWIMCAERGRRLTPEGYRAMFGGSEAQEVLGFLDPGEPGEPRLEERHDVLGDRERIKRMLGLVERVRREGLGRDEALVELVRGAPEEKFLLFTMYQDTALGLGRALVRGLGARARVGVVTGEGAWVTGLGSVGAPEAMRRFAPQALGAGSMAAHQELQVLVATDCLSLGVNLQDCGRVALVDLPYTPLGVEQRVGRLLRPGGPHEEVRVYLARPRDWSDSLGMRQRLWDKLGQASAAGTPYQAVSHVMGSEESPVFRGEVFLDALTGRLDEGWEPGPRARGLWVGEHDGPRVCVACVEERVGTRRALRWLMVRDGALEVRVERMREVLVGMMDGAWGLASTAVGPGPELEVMQAHVEEARGRVMAAALAPGAVGQGRRWWAWLESEEVRERVWLAPEAWEAWRERLGRGWPRGVEAALGWGYETRERRTVRENLRWLEALLPVPRPATEIRSTVVTAVWLLPRRSGGV